MLYGAITGSYSMAGADVGGDMAMIQGQNKQTKLQEWTSWKQWALDHKDFPKFQPFLCELMNITKTLIEN